ncbi:putative calcium-binding protein CML31 [Bidens hawaiensis]|uniref:putative calcium-binding protein CML31 n=1 Tax=Bidens hawaiensis TaxID=980011 RepID=UPI0040496C31
MDKEQQYKHVFRRLDKNGDGKLSPTELQMCIESIGRELSSEEAEIMAELMDSDGDGLLSLEELVRVVEGANDEQKYKHVFRRLDKNGDGKLSPTELQMCIESIGRELSSEEAEIMAELMDSDGDGLLSLEELVRVVEGANDEQKVNDLKMAFKMYEDIEGSGFITSKSLRRMLSRLGESTTVEECELMITKFDLDGNGILDFDEFQDMMSLPS